MWKNMYLFWKLWKWKVFEVSASWENRFSGLNEKDYWHKGLEISPEVISLKALINTKRFQEKVLFNFLGVCLTVHRPTPIITFGSLYIFISHTNASFTKVETGQSAGGSKFPSHHRVGHRGLMGHSWRSYNRVRTLCSESGLTDFIGFHVPESLGRTRYRECIYQGFSELT